MTYPCTTLYTRTRLCGESGSRKKAKRTHLLGDDDGDQVMSDHMDDDHAWGHGGMMLMLSSPTSLTSNRLSIMVSKMTNYLLCLNHILSSFMCSCSRSLDNLWSPDGSKCERLTTTACEAVETGHGWGPAR